ncbi:hypothetical protein [Nocardia sp. NPDC051570]|uniref:hypothetical protein n=1 Tax=Nocardia sp. NPDC051570 TaxID=3364324 RepID=UPI0037A942C1
MSTTLARTAKTHAPCGRIVDLECFEDDDGFGMISHIERYGCGCRSVRHDYHDGSVGERTIRHDGRELPPTVLPDQGC